MLFIFVSLPLGYSRVRTLQYKDNRGILTRKKTDDKMLFQFQQLITLLKGTPLKLRSMVTVIRARLKLYKKDNGRKTPFITGYRPIFSFEDREIKTSGQIILVDRSELSPGEEDEVQIHFLSEFLGKGLRKGTKFTFSEGGIPLGEGTVK